MSLVSSIMPPPLTEEVLSAGVKEESASPSSIWSTYLADTVTVFDFGTVAVMVTEFKPDSPELLEGEREKLDRIAQILSLFPDNDLLISGHTAVANNGVDSKQLSADRAQTVADYLINLGVRERQEVFTLGFGDTLPIAPNTTEEGRAKNRRVEITIMDK